MKIPFNKPPFVASGLDYMREAVSSGCICGNGNFNRKCQSWLEKYSGSSFVALTTSCSHSLEMAALLCDIKPGDEVIMPSYTFVSTANAFALRGAKCVFVDIRPDTMNMDERVVEDAVSDRTRAIVPVHYAGVGCEMDVIDDIAKRHGLFVVEDAAHAVNAFYKNHPLGSIGDFGCFSFHETKNYTMGEGGAILVRDKKFAEHADMIREKGTNRTKFHNGEVDRYTWETLGSSYLPSELNAAYLFAQLECADKILENRLASWNAYYERLKLLATDGFLELPHVPAECRHNGHMFYVKVQDLDCRNRLLSHLQKNGILAVFHYVPLHISPAGRKYGVFHGNDVYTTSESDRLVRLPMYYDLSLDDIEFVCNKIAEFFKK